MSLLYRFIDACKAAHAAFVASWRGDAGESGPEARFSGYSVSSGSVNAVPPSLSGERRLAKGARFHVMREVGDEYQVALTTESGAEARDRVEALRADPSRPMWRLYERGKLRDWGPR